MSRPPLTLAAAAALQGALSLAVLALGGYGFVYTLSGSATAVSVALPLAVLGVAVGAVLGYVAWGLFTANDWARTPVVVTQLFMLPVAWYLLQAGAPAIAGALAGTAAAALGLVLAPTSTAALFPEEPKKH